MDYLEVVLLLIELLFQLLNPALLLLYKAILLRRRLLKFSNLLPLLAQLPSQVLCLLLQLKLLLHTSCDLLFSIVQLVL